MDADHPWCGYYFMAVFDRWQRKYRDKCMVQQPEGALHYGSSNGWIREMLVMKICDRPGFVSEFTFGFWRGTSGIAEVRDVTLEEICEPPRTGNVGTGQCGVLKLWRP